jgi:hypothetical protein
VQAQRSARGVELNRIPVDSPLGRIALRLERLDPAADFADCSVRFAELVLQVVVVQRRGVEFGALVMQAHLSLLRLGALRRDALLETRSARTGQAWNEREGDGEGGDAAMHYVRK